jgi:hypothetical protein
MSASIGSAIIGAVGRQTLWLRLVDGSGNPTKLSALNSSVVVTVNGSAHTYATSSMLWGYGGGSGQYWPSVVVWLNSALAGTETVTVTTTSGWCTTAAGSATAQANYRCTFAVKTALSLPSTNLGLRAGVNLTQYQICYTPVTPFYANLSLCQDYLGSAGSNGSGWYADGTTGYLASMGTATFVDTILIDTAGNGHDGFGWPNCPQGPATWTVSWTGPDGYQLTSRNGDTVTLTGSSLSGTNKYRTYSITAQSGYRAPRLNLRCTSAGTSNLNVYYAVTGTTGSNKWDPGFLARIKQRQFIRCMDAFYTNQSTRADQTEEPKPGCASLIASVYGGPVGRRQQYIASLTPYADTEGRYPPSRVAINVNTGSNAHGLKDGMPVTLSGLDSQGPHGNGTFDVKRPHPGDPFGNAISLAGTGSGASATAVNFGTGSSLQFSGAFSLEFYVECGRTGVQECLVSQYVPGTASGYRFRIYKQPTGEVYTEVYVDGTGLHYAQLRTFGTQLNDTNRHFIGVYCDGTQMQIFIDGPSINTVKFSGGMNAHSDGSAPFVVGAQGDGSMPFEGIIDEVRFSSTCRINLSNTSNGPFSSPFSNDTQTALLAHFDSATGPYYTQDSSTNAISAKLQGSTLPSLVASPWTGGSYSGFTGAVSFPGTGSGSTTSFINCGTASALNFSGAFTIEFKFKIPATYTGPGAYIAAMVNSSDAAGNMWQIILGGDSRIYTNVYTNSSGGNISLSGSVISDTNIHSFAWSCDGTNLRLYVDGSQQASVACSGFRTGADGTAPLTLGGSLGGGPAPIIMCDFRVSNVARYTGTTYTPATSPLTSDSSTVVLYNLSSTVGTTYTDSSSNGNTGTSQGSPTIPSLVTSPWYVAPSPDTTVGTVPIYAAYQNYFVCHVVDNYNFTIGAQGDGTFTVQAGDYLAAANIPSSTGYFYAISQMGMSTLDAIDLANEASCDLWYNFPTIGTNAYATWVGQQLYNNLNPARKVYVELGNELWNGEFPQYDYATQQGNITGMTLQQWCVYRAQQVVGLIKAQMGPRASSVYWVMGVQNGSNGPGGDIDLRARAAFAQGAPYPDYCAGAPYEWLSPNEAVFGPLYDTIYSTNPGALLDVAEAWINDPFDTPANLSGMATVLTNAGLTTTKICHYEGTPDYLGFSSAANTTGSSSASALYSQYIGRHPQFYYVMTKYLQNVSPGYPTLYADFNFSDPPGNQEPPASPNPTIGTAMWGKCTSYKNVNNYGTGISPSLYNNASNPWDLLNLEDVAAKAIDDWNAKGSGSHSNRTLDWYGFLGD